eukprot:CAMPEP_0177632458 /NCGR_PEP_ID=MMETSP0447-20121125/2304_1 /TAXON_ID=0 /ORGANISM="Stygamoeba regulata, Strain BSH-02190019" /LENGTH=961 /DNA_ID=CAMNT_0019134031 /DNA_START=54 /DNA_END=2939 /DNA_ORIENTATION=-
MSAKRSTVTNPPESAKNRPPARSGSTATQGAGTRTPPGGDDANNGKTKLTAKRTLSDADEPHTALPSSKWAPTKQADDQPDVCTLSVAELRARLAVVSQRVVDLNEQLTLDQTKRNAARTALSQVDALQAQVTVYRLTAQNALYRYRAELEDLEGASKLPASAVSPLSPASQRPHRKKSRSPAKKAPASSPLASESPATEGGTSGECAHSTVSPDEKASSSKHSKHSSANGSGKQTPSKKESNKKKANAQSQQAAVASTAEEEEDASPRATAANSSSSSGSAALSRASLDSAAHAHAQGAAAATAAGATGSGVDSVPSGKSTAARRRRSLSGDAGSGMKPRGAKPGSHIESGSHASRRDLEAVTTAAGAEEGTPRKTGSYTSRRRKPLNADLPEDLSLAPTTARALNKKSSYSTISGALTARSRAPSLRSFFSRRDSSLLSKSSSAEASSLSPNIAVRHSLAWMENEGLLSPALTSFVRSRMSFRAAQSYTGHGAQDLSVARGDRVVVLRYVGDGVVNGALENRLISVGELPLNLLEGAEQSLKKKIAAMTQQEIDSLSKSFSPHFMTEIDRSAALGKFLSKAEDPVVVEVLPINDPLHRITAKIGRLSTRQSFDDGAATATLSPFEEGLQLFSTSYKRGLECWTRHGLITEDPDDIAVFLLKHDVNKQELGELIGDRGDRCTAIRRAFCRKLDFVFLDLDIALRRFLHSFRLPGEAQKIDRIMESFAETYFEQNPQSCFKHPDAVFLLAFSCVMLNTDAHSSSIKKKMTKAQFVYNTRGINDGEDLPVDFLEDLYDRIVDDEIKMNDKDAVLPNATKRGWLHMEIRSSLLGVVRLKRRWVVLDGHVLHLFKSPQDKQPFLKYPLDNHHVIMLDRVRKTNLYHFLVERHSCDESNDDDNLKLSTEGETVMKRWVQAITHAIERHQQSLTGDECKTKAARQPKAVPPPQSARTDKSKEGKIA